MHGVATNMTLVLLLGQALRVCKYAFCDTVQRYCANELMKCINEGHVIRSSYDAVGDMDDGRPATTVM